MFSNWRNFKDTNLDNFDTSKVTNLCDMFKDINFKHVPGFFDKSTSKKYKLVKNSNPKNQCSCGYYWDEYIEVEEDV